MVLRLVLVTVIVFNCQLVRAGNHGAGIIPGAFLVSSFEGYLPLNSFKQNCFFCRNTEPEILTPGIPENQAVIQHIINCPVSTTAPTPTNNPSQSVGNEQTSSSTANSISQNCYATGDNDKGNNGGMPPDSSLAVCEVCNNCQTAPGEKRCIYCLSADDQETPAEGGASPPVCVRCGEYRDGQLRDNQWVCNTCFVPHNDLMAEGGVFGVNECMICTSDDGILYPIACGHGFFIHTGCLAQMPKGTILCPQCQIMVGVVPVENIPESIFEPRPVEPITPSPSLTNHLMFGGLSHVSLTNSPFSGFSRLEQWVMAAELARGMQRNGLSVTSHQVLQILRANSWMNYDLAQALLPGYFQSPQVRAILESQTQPQVDPTPTRRPQRQRKCILQ